MPAKAGIQGWIGAQLAVMDSRFLVGMTKPTSRGSSTDFSYAPLEELVAAHSSDLVKVLQRFHGSVLWRAGPDISGKTGFLAFVDGTSASLLRWGQVICS